MSRILVIEDTESVREELVELLRLEGHDPLAAADGHAGMRLAIANAPDLILCDILMPGIDGYETVRLLKANENTRSIPVIFITAVGHEDAVVRGLDVGAVDYVRKPFRIDELLARIDTHLTIGKLRREQQAAVTQLAHAHGQLLGVLDAAQDAIAMFGMDRRLAFANRHYWLLFAIDDGQPGSPPACLDIDVFEEAERVVECIVELGEPNPTQYHVFAAPVTDPDGAVIGRLFAFRDMTKDNDIREMQTEVERLRGQLTEECSFGNLIGRSAPMRRLYESIRQVANSNVTVLIEGESGVGKEVIAKALHFNSHRGDAPFVAVNCAGIPESLIESELFGHEKGAFTGATETRVGKFEQADGGTLLLDEIGEMPLDMQPKLLRVLQEREVERVGGGRPIPVDVRIIAATNRSLRDDMAEGRFREDLYYRVADFPLTIPPLRERAEDIPLLFDHFLEKYAAEAEKSIVGAEPDALRALVSHPWPGNVRELESAVRHAVLIETSTRVRLASLPPHVQDATAPVDSADVRQETVASALGTLDEAEAHVLRRTLAATDHDVARAADILGVNRATMYRKLRKHGLSTKPS